ncbi:hypothetical protein [Paenibacillus polymyxa]|uniref:hypothetical protein n=1 Tax=Paenibacillus polymyxa TaxID=1406 RepID=UPI0023783AF0|nr:hypothetical protein [Paenibacillus polymyxa]WDM22283.1 hypothetical protein J4I02_01015 [Paenibacillus polymyxa]
MPTLTFTEKEKRALATLIQEQIDTHLTRFPYARYPVYPLEEWKRLLCDPANVAPTILKQILGWTFGGWQRKDLPSAQSNVVRTVIKLWPEFTEKMPSESAGILQFWEDRLTNWTNGFQAVSFLLHLMRPDEYEITDSHRLQAMYELLQTINHQENDRSLSRSLLDLENYTSFFRAILPKLSFGDHNRIQLDRFLKAYGNRHAYKNVDSSYMTSEPHIWQFSWNDAKTEHYDLEKITLRSNADVLFACLLSLLDKQPDVGQKLTIEQVVELLPLGTGGICNPASFKYALISLFGKQKGRDYFITDDSSLQQAFTVQANQSTRDMKFYTHFQGTKITVNKKYIKEHDL